MSEPDRQPVDLVADLDDELERVPAEYGVALLRETLDLQRRRPVALRYVTGDRAAIAEVRSRAGLE